MNQDQIKIIGEFKSVESMPDVLLLKVVLEINGTAIKWNHVDVYSIAHYWANHDPDGFTRQRFSLFEPFSCSCGVAGCASIWDGIYIKTRKHSVEWRTKLENGYGFLPKTFFSFERAHYLQAQKDFMHWLSIQENTEKKLCIDLGHFEGDEVTIDGFFSWLSNK
jgi:hypothetical protein